MAIKRRERIKNRQNSKEKTDKTESNDKKRKPRYPCFICDEDHFTKEFPHRAEVVKFVKGSQQPAILKDPFPTQDSKMIGST